MNSIFRSELNGRERISFNRNKIIIVPEDSARRSQDYNSKKKVPLRIGNNIISGTMESNSNQTDDEGLSAKNVMIASEDSSEWSQDFVRVNKSEAALGASESENQELGEEEDQLEITEEAASKNRGGDRKYTERMSNSEDVEDGEPSDELLNADLRCRTCLNIVDLEESIPLYTLEPSGETLKELLIYLLPQMVSTVCDEDVVCKQCDTSIKFCVDFIDNCLKVENELLNDCDDQTLEEFQDEEEKYNPEDKTHVPLDHDYMVLPQMKTEVETLMETEDTADNLLSNDDPTLASADEFLFECFRCGMTFESEKFLDIHARTEHGITETNEDSASQEERIYYKCNDCEVLFATKKAYNFHVRTSHVDSGDEASEKGMYICRQCGSKFAYLGLLLDHRRMIHGFTCKICPERFNTKGELDVHVESHPDLYFCEVCTKSFKTKRAMSSHMKIHDNKSVNMCDECGRNFNTQAELFQHLEQDEHPARKVAKQFRCELCDSAFVDRKRLNKHKQVFHDFGPENLCVICDKNFSSKTSLDSHYRLKHAEVKPYQCERCGERFARLDYLRRHNSCSDANQCKKFMKGPRRKFRYTKGDGEPIKCKLCGKVFKDVYLLKLHLTTHTNLRRFRCSICNLTFTTNKNRERHEKIHDDPLSKYRCTVCWKRTQSQEELDSHMMSHEKKYQCHVCHESFARVYLLNYHVSEVHADDEDVEKEKQIVFTEGLKEYLVDYDKV